MLDRLNAWHLYDVDRQAFMATDGGWLSVAADEAETNGRKVAEFTDAEMENVAWTQRATPQGARWVTPLQASMIVVDLMRPTNTNPKVR